MNINKQEELDILRKINDKDLKSQRQIAKDIGMSLGKLNYCLKALKKKGLVKFLNFKKNKNKHKYLYILTPKGITHKTRLAINFMRIKMQEYDELKKEINEKN